MMEQHDIQRPNIVDLGPIPPAVSTDPPMVHCLSTTTTRAADALCCPQ
jgi:hypothetical protein